MSPAQSAEAGELRCAECGGKSPATTDFCLRCGAALAAPVSPHSAWRVYGVLTPYVGRDAEVGQLIEAIGEVRERGGARLVVVQGPEGAGKSRLVDALNERLIAEVPDAVMPRASARDGAPPFDAFVQLLCDRLYISTAARDIGPAVRARLAALVGAGGDEVARRVVEGLGVAGGGPFDADPAWVRALAQALRVDASRQPLVMVFDDFDRLDAESRAALAELLIYLAQVPVVVVVTCADSSAVNEVMRGVDVPRLAVTLGSLTDEQLEVVVRGLLSRVDPLDRELVERIVVASLGSPFVAEESVRILIRGGVLEPRREHWVFHSELLYSVELPTEVEGAVRARLARLSAAETALLRDAALIGDTFWLSGLVALARLRAGEADLATASGDEPREGLRREIEALVDRDVLRAHPISALRGDAEYAFKHRVERRLHLQDVPAAVRSAGHLRLAQWLQLRSMGDPERFLVAIADHYEAAGAVARAGEFLVRAGRLCRDRYMTDRAIAYLERALRALDPSDAVARADVLDDLGRLYLRAGRHTDARAAFETTASLAWGLASERRVASSLLHVGRAMLAVGDYDDALDALARAESGFEALEDATGLAAALDEIGRVFWIRGHYDQAETRYRRALELRRAEGDDRALARSLSNIGSLLVQRGQFSVALEQFREALQLRREAGDIPGVAESLNAIGVVFLERGDHASAIRIWTEAVEVAREAGDRGLEATTLNNLGEAEIADGLLDAAREHLRAACDIAERSEERRIVFDAIRNLGVLEARSGNVRLAVDLGEEALDVARALRSRSMEALALRTLGELHGQTVYDDSADGPEAVAEAAFRSAVAIFKEIGDETELGRTYHAYGTFLIEHRQLVLGKKHLEMAREIFQRTELKKILVQTEATIREL
ncbi:MAG: tetratricopeptide repeat protein [Myxococcales bacterium]|nr:tetratricopeptide repeat protein [Myxococcales bacterium]